MQAVAEGDSFVFQVGQAVVLISGQLKIHSLTTITKNYSKLVNIINRMRKISIMFWTK